MPPFQLLLVLPARRKYLLCGSTRVVTRIFTPFSPNFNYYYYSSQAAYVVCIPQHHQTCTCVSTLSPTPMHTQCIQTAYFHSNSNTYITPTFCFLFSVDPHSFASHSGPDTPVSLSTRVKTEFILVDCLAYDYGSSSNYQCPGQC